MEEESCRIKPSSHQFKLDRSRVSGIKANAGVLLIARLRAHFQGNVKLEASHETSE